MRLLESSVWQRELKHLAPLALPCPDDQMPLDIFSNNATKLSFESLPL